MSKSVFFHCCFSFQDYVGLGLCLEEENSDGGVVVTSLIQHGTASKVEQQIHMLIYHLYHLTTFRFEGVFFSLFYSINVSNISAFRIICETDDGCRF